MPIAVMAQWEADRKLSTLDSAIYLNENMGRCLAVSGDSVHVVWWAHTADGSAIYCKHSFDAGLTWSADMRLTPSPSNADFPSVAVNGATVHIAYRESSSGQGVTMYKRSLDGGNTWDANVSLGNYYWWPSITSAGSKVFVALNDNHPGNTEVYCRRSTDNGATWDTVHQISNALKRSEDPSIAAGSGCVVLAWNDNRTDTMQTWYRRSSDQGVIWGPETQLTHTTVFSYFPFINISESNVDLVWGDRRNNNTFEIFYRHSSDYGVTWGGENQISHSGGTAFYPEFVRDRATIHMVWTGSSLPLHYVHSSDGGTSWDSLNLVSGTSKPSNSFVAFGGSVVHVIWADQRNGKTAVYYKRNPTGNPQTVAQIAAPILSHPIDLAINLSSIDTLIWNPVTGATQYELQLSTRPDFAATVIDDSTLITLSRIITGLADSTKFYWRVRGRSNGVLGAWSTVWMFNTAPPPTGVNAMAATLRSFEFVSIAPDPFRDETCITLESLTPMVMSLHIIDMLGRTVASPLVNRMVDGKVMCSWRPNGLAAGTYAFRLTANGAVHSRTATRVH